MLWFVLELVVAIAIFVAAVWLYRRQTRLDQELSRWAELVEIVAFVAIAVTISTFVIDPLLWRFAPDVAATGHTYGRSVETPLDHVIFAYTIVIWFGYMAVRPTVFSALGLHEGRTRTDAGPTEQATLGSDEE